MAFVDDLGLVEALLLLVASVFAYVGFLGFLAIRSNRPVELRSILRGSAVPAGGLGLTIFGLAIWGEMTWPFPAADNLAGYNIFFFDPMMLLGIVLLAYAAVTYRGVALQYVGLVAAVAGVAVMFYGWTGYTASTPFTKDPLDTFLMYGAFGLGGLVAFPTTVLVDHFLAASDRGELPWSLFTGHRRPVLQRMGVRGAQPVVPGAAPSTEASESVSVPSLRAPIVVQVLLLVFPVVMVLAGIAAGWYFATTLPGHLGAGPAGAP